MIAALAGTVAVSGGVGAAWWDGSSAAGASTAMVAAAPSAPAVPAGAKLLGAQPAKAVLHVSVALQPSDPAGLEQLATEVSTPGDPGYRQFLDPAQVQAEFGPAAGTVAAIRAWLTSAGLRVGATTGDGLDIPVTGTSSVVEGAFRTGIDRYRLAGGSVYANTAPPEVPAGLQPAVAGVLGLDDLQGGHNDLAPRHPVTKVTVDVPPPAPAVSGAPSACSAAAAKDADTASDIATLYDLDPLYRKGRLGQGVTIGLFENGNYKRATIATFERCYGIRTRVTTVRVDGGIGPVRRSTGEVLLDLETVVELAPDATILDYEGDGTTTSFASYYDVYAAMVQQDRAEVLSTSWGYSNCEADMVDGGVNRSLVEAPLFEEMALQGQSMLAAVGDQGSEGCASTVTTTGVNLGTAPTPYGLTVEDPADQPFITAIGGTMVDGRTTTPAQQQAWNDAGPGTTGRGFASPFDGRDRRLDGYPTTGNLAGNGGVSVFFPQPPWQVGFDTGNGRGAPCGSPTTATGRPIDCRELPDASGLATAVVSYTNGHWTETAGTSAASPQWAAFLALADQGAPQGRLGLVSPALYRIDGSDPAAFTDIVKGENDYLSDRSLLPATTKGNRTCTYTVKDKPTSHQPCYRAVPGYDMATGLGTPVGARLAADLDALVESDVGSAPAR